MSGVLLAALLLAAVPAQAASLPEWRAAVTTARQLAENDGQAAYQEARRLQAELPRDAGAADKVRVLNVLTRAEVYLGLVDQADKHAQQAYEMAQSLGDRIGQAEAQLNVAMNAINQARIDVSTAAIVRSLEVLEGVDRPDLLAEALLRMSMMYRRQGDLDNSVTMAMQTMELANRSNDPYTRVNAYQGLAIAFEQSGRFVEALEYYRKMREQSRVAASKRLEAHAVQGMGLALADQGDMAGAERLVREALAMFRAQHLPFSINFALYGLADLLEKQNRHLEAVAQYDEMAAIYGKYPNRIGRWFMLIARSKAQQQLKRMAAARTDAEQSYVLAREINQPVYLSGSARRLSEVAAIGGDFQHAYQLSIEAVNMADKAAREKAGSRLVELAQRYETESKQRKINELTRQAEHQAARQRWLWTVLGGSVALLVITAFFIVRLRRSSAEIRLLNIGLEQRVQERTAELRQQARYLRTLIDMLPMWAWFKDTGNRYLAVNQAAAEAYGRNVEDILGKSDLQIMPVEVAQSHYADDAEVMATRQRKSVEEIVKSKHGDIWMETYKAAVLDEDGTVLGTVGVARDISERKVTEYAREAALAEAERLARSRSEFLAQMSHELRTPLNGILGYAQILSRDKRLDERQLAGVQVIRQSGEHLLTLINDILDFSKIEAGKMGLVRSDIELEKFLRTIAGIMRIKADEKRLEFVCATAPDLPAWIHVDEKRLRQVLLNLLSNAVKFTDRGRVVLRVELLPRGRLRFEVQDSGIGIAQDQLENIFQPFEQLGDQQYRLGGTGLGLPISRQIMRLMGSEIYVNSKPGQGSAFWFEIEAGATGVDAAAVQKRSIEGYAGERKTILVADDAEENRAVAVEMLAQLGFQTIAVGNGRDMLESAQAHRTDLILTDSVMPVMDGLEATRRLRKTPGLETIPVIAISASASGEDEAYCLAAGANVFLPKPLDLAQLLVQVGTLLKLDWIYRRDEAAVPVAPEALVVPPYAEIANLHHLAQTGSMRDIQQYAEQLIATDERYRPFAEQLRSMALGYQTRAIMGFVEQHLSGKAALE